MIAWFASRYFVLVCSATLFASFGRFAIRTYLSTALHDRHHGNRGFLRFTSDHKLPFRVTQPPSLTIQFRSFHKESSQTDWKGVLDGLDWHGFQVDVSTYASLLRFCGKEKVLSDGKRTHHHIIKQGLERGTFMANLFIQMYGNCGALQDAGAVFAALHQRDKFTWNFIIRAFASHTRTMEAFQLFEGLQLAGVIPDRFIFVGVLSACATPEDLAGGKLMHARIARSGLESDVVICTALVNMYAKCGNLEDAWMVFDQIPDQDAVSCNAMITAFSQFGQGKKSIQLFRQMQQQAVLPERVTLLSILSACGIDKELAEGIQMHACILGSAWQVDVALGTALVNMYGKCDSLEHSRRTFDRMLEHDVVSWNTIILVYAQHGFSAQALQLFEEMQPQGVMPDKITFLTILDACASHELPADEKWIQANIKDTPIGSDVDVGAAVVNMYSKCDRMECAWEFFNTLPNCSAASWNAMIAAFSRNGQLGMALLLFEDMLQNGVFPDKVTIVTILDACASQAALREGKHLHTRITGCDFQSDIVVRTSLLSMYGRCCRLDEAQDIFDEMYNKNVVLWNVMMAAYVQNGQGKKALNLFEQMHMEGAIPNMATFVCILDACACQPAHCEGKQIHCRIMGIEYDSDCVLGTALVYMYVKCGNMKAAQLIFDELPEKDIVSWTAMISGCVQHGQGIDALKMFNQMQVEGGIPDKVTFVSILPAFTSHAALAEAKQMHVRIVDSRFELDVVVGTALVSMYSKCGRLGEAQMMFNNMLDRNLVSWNALISGYTQDGHTKEAFQMFDQMQQEGMMPDSVTIVSILDACSNQAALTKGEQIYAGIVGSGLEPDNVVGTALVNMYGKCGCLKEALRIFNSISMQNMVSWTAIIAAYARHGHGKEALQLFHQMQQHGVVPNKVTFVNILSACSHAGLVDEGKYLFDFMTQKNSISPELDHCNCMIDLLGRAGMLDEAEAFISSMSHEPTVLSWMTLLGACRNKVDVERAKRAAFQLFQLESENAETYVVLSNIYAAAGSEDKSVMVLK